MSLLHLIYFEVQNPALTFQSIQSHGYFVDTSWLSRKGLIGMPNKVYESLQYGNVHLFTNKNDASIIKKFMRSFVR